MDMISILRVNLNFSFYSLFLHSSRLMSESINTKLIPSNEVPKKRKRCCSGYCCCRSFACFAVLIPILAAVACCALYFTGYSRVDNITMYFLQLPFFIPLGTTNVLSSGTPPTSTTSATSLLTPPSMTRPT